MSIVFVAFGSSASSSSGVDQHVAVGRDLVALDDLLERHLLAGRRIDPLLRIRAPVLLESWWKRTVFGEVALYSLTGTLTSPKLIAPDQIARAIYGFV